MADIFRRLKRDPDRGWVAGVCVGLADYFDWSVKLIRVIFVLGLIFSGFFPMGLIYLALWYLMDPVEPGEVIARPFEEAATGSGYYSGTAAPRTTMTDVKARFSALDERLRHIEECVASNEFELRRELKKLES